MGACWRIKQVPLNNWLRQLIESYTSWFMLDLWPLKYPCTNVDQNLFLQKCKQQHLDKLKDEVKTPWVYLLTQRAETHLEGFFFFFFFFF